MSLFFNLLSFLFGLVVGSFLNVCIVRLPAGESIVHPGSHCRHCRAPVAPYDNIPVLSYLLLRGRCRHCRERISLLYPAVELLTGLTFALVYWRFGLTLEALKAALLAAALIVLIFTDWRSRVLPDVITLPGLVVGVVFAAVVPLRDGTTAFLLRALDAGAAHPALLSVLDALLGALLGAGLLFGLGELWYRLRHVEGMGLGDVKMMGMLGLFFGVKLTVLTLLLGSLAGTVVGGFYMLLTGKDSQYELPLGSFLGVAGLVALFWGPLLIAGYLRLVG